MADDGPAIPAATLPHIFEEFVRAAYKADDGGDGFGLAVTRGIVETHRDPRMRR